MTVYRLDLKRDVRDKNELIYSPPQNQVLPIKATNIGWRPPIRDQGQEGCCGAETGTELTEVIRAKLGKTYRKLSPQYVYNRILFEENNGDTSQDTGCQIKTIPVALHKWGACRELVWPFTNAFSTTPSKEAFLDATWNRISEARRITTVYDLRYAIAIDKLPVAIGINCYESLMADTTAATGHIPLPAPGDKVIGGHALLCDGYDFSSDPVFMGPNSWGPDWGDHGGYYLPHEFIESADCLSDIWCIVK